MSLLDHVHKIAPGGSHFQFSLLWIRHFSNGLINMDVGLFDVASENGEIELLSLSFLECFAGDRCALWGRRHNQEPRGGIVQSVDQKRCGLGVVVERGPALPILCSFFTNPQAKSRLMSVVLDSVLRHCAELCTLDGVCLILCSSGSNA